MVGISLVDQQLPTGWAIRKIGDVLSEVKRNFVWNNEANYDLLSVRRRSGGVFFRQTLPAHKILTKDLRIAKKGDFLISTRQVVHGATGLVKSEHDGMKISGSYVILVPKGSAEVLIEYFSLVSQQPEFYHLCYVTSFGVHIEKLTFDFQGFLREKIMLPPISEQRRIIEVIGTWDEAILAQTKLLEALRAQQQALVQQLLTGIIRLPGFEGPWKKMRLNALFEVLPTANNSRADLAANGNIAYLHYGDIHTKYHVQLDVQRATLPFLQADKESSRAAYIQNGDVVVVDASEDFKAIGKAVEVCGIKDHKIVAGLHTILLRPSSILSAEGFRGYLLLHPMSRRHLESMASGAAVYGLSKSNLLNTPVWLPPFLEQQAIANVLNTAADEIRLREAELKALLKQKRGLMQKLLSGQLRVNAAPAY